MANPGTKSFIFFLLILTFLFHFSPVSADEKGENIAAEIESRLENQINSWTCNLELQKNNISVSMFSLSYSKGNYNIVKKSGTEYLKWLDMGVERLFRYIDEYIFDFKKNANKPDHVYLTVKNRSLAQPITELLVDSRKHLVRSALVKFNSRTLLKYNFSYTTVSGIDLLSRVNLIEKINFSHSNTETKYSCIFSNHSVMAKKRGSSFLPNGKSQAEKDAEKYLKRAVIYHENNTTPLAVKAVQQALEKWPWVIRKADSSLIALVQKRCNRILLLNPASSKAYYSLGCISLYYRKNQEAKKYFDTLKKISPESPLIKFIEKFHKTPILSDSAIPVDISDSFKNVGMPEKLNFNTGPVSPSKGALKNTGVLKFKISGQIQGRYYAKVILENLDSSFSRTVEAMQGKFLFMNISPGIYRIYPDIGKKTVNYDETVTMKDDFTEYESVEIEVIDEDITDIEILITE